LETQKSAPGIQVRKFTVEEAHGFLWLWHSEVGLDHSVSLGPEWFDEIPPRAVSLTTSEVIRCHVTRAIENQLDYAHLGVVHKSTIGRGFDPSIQPRFQLEDRSVRFFLRDLRNGNESQICFKTPNIWLNQITSRFVITLCFVPIDHQSTKLYLTSHQNFLTLPVLGKILNWLLNKLNVYILREDSSVINSHPPGPSLASGVDERLFFSDRAIRHFRKIWQSHL
jgi:phenylpropionate dioxygenase-like ring-hydroxylating dioxygenase large terminal subunit